MHPKTGYEKNHSVAGMPAEGMGIQARIQGLKEGGFSRHLGALSHFFWICI